MRLMGGLVVEGLRPAEVGSRKARTLLGALAVHRRPVSTDSLADILWGDHLPSRPADQIGVLVSRLRGVVGGDRIVRHDAGYALAADWIDVEELAARTDRAQERLRVGDPVSARLAATMALDLARGPLLPEEEGAWLDGPRLAVARTVAAVGLVAAEAALQVGDLLGAAAAAGAALDHDPYDEAALRVLMRAHAMAGRPGSALAAYAHVRARLAEDLGTSPDSDTEALHDQLVRGGPAAGVAEPAAPAVRDGWDPLVQRARGALAANDIDAARQAAEEAVRRGGGPGALEMAGWAAYYGRDFEAALRWAEDAAARTDEPERRASCLTLAGRVRHSRGDLLGAARQLEEAVTCEIAGVRAMGSVWLGSLRVHQGRPVEALGLVAEGAVDAAALRHPFLIPHSMSAQTYALGELGRVADALAAVDRWDRTLEELGGAGSRFRPMAANFRGWVLGAIGQRAEARDCHLWAMGATDRFEEPKGHSLLDLASLCLQEGDGAGARAWLDELAVPPDEHGAMAWHQRQRLHLLEARLCILDGAPDDGGRLAAEVAADAAERGSHRAARQAQVVVALAAAAAGEQLYPAEVLEVLDALAPMGALEAWRATAELAAATGWHELWARAEAAATPVVEASGERRHDVRGFVAQELARLGRP